MPATSKAQRRFFGLMAHNPKMAKKAGIDMTKAQMMDYASTPEKGLPEKSPNALRAAVMGRNKVVNRVAKARRRMAA